MIRIYCSRADATLLETETLTAGMVNIPDVLFTFSSDWEGLGKTAIVRAGTVIREVILVNNQITIPAECLAKAGVNLIVGVWGGNFVTELPTVWCACGEIQDSTNPSAASNHEEATSSNVAQMLAAMERAEAALDEIENADWQAVADKVGNEKVNKPLSSPNGTAGQVLRTLGNGNTEWADAASPTDEQVNNAVSGWLDEHPEATTTVQDGSITRVKLDTDLVDATDYAGLLLSEEFGNNVLPDVDTAVDGSGRTIAGVTFTRNLDDSITIDGEPTENAFYRYIGSSNRQPIPAGTYTAALSPRGSTTTFELYINILNSDESTQSYRVTGNPVTFTVEDGATWYANVIAHDGVSFDNLIIYPMVNVGTKTGLKYNRKYVGDVVSRIEDFEVCNTFTDALSSTAGKVLVLNDNSSYGLGGSMLFEKRPGETWRNYARSNGSYIAPVFGQGNIPESSACYNDIMPVILSYINNDNLEYGNNHTSADETCTDEIDCASFVSTVLSGVRYENSRYIEGNEDNTRDEYGVILPDGHTSHRMASLKAGELANYFAQQKRLVPISSSAPLGSLNRILRFGDILFITSPSYEDVDKFTHGIGHVAIYLGTALGSSSSSYGNRICVAQCGGSPSSLTASNFHSTVGTFSALNLTLENIGTYLVAFARPDYGSRHKQSASETISGRINTEFIPGLLLSTSVGIPTSIVKHQAADIIYHRVEEGQVVSCSTGAHSVYLHKYDADQNYVGYKRLKNNNTVDTYTVESGTRFVRFGLYSGSESTTLPTDTLMSTVLSVSASS